VAGYHNYKFNFRRILPYSYDTVYYKVYFIQHVYSKIAKHSEKKTGLVTF